MIDPKSKSELKAMIARYLAGSATPEEKRFVEAYFDYTDQIAKERETGETDLSSIKSRIFDRINAETQETEQSEPMVVPIRPRKRIWWAAAAILLFAAGGYYILNKKTEKPTDTIAVSVPSNDVKAPSLNRATITLASGQKVFLDSVANGTLATQGNVQIKKSGDGIITYNGNGQPKNEIVYNTLTNPRGSKVIDITLSDGSQVWLNAESSLKYPVAFNGRERKVEITGEAYFEVAHDQSKPFRVTKGNTEVEVLGTHFNMNAYDDEPSMKVTLLEGSVMLSTENNQSKRILKPGQQGIVGKDIKVTNDVNLEQVMAWKNGVFRFNNTNIEEIMKQVKRWYDVEIVYHGDFSDLDFGGSVSRKSNVSELLKRLAATESFHYTIEGKKINLIK